MAKLTTSNLSSLANETSAINTINANFALVATAMDNTLSRDGTATNTMSADLDMNGNDILNVGALLLVGSTTIQDALISTPAVTVDNSIVRWNGTDGTAIDDTTAWLIDDTDAMTAGGSINMNTNSITGVVNFTTTGGGTVQFTDSLVLRAKLKDYSEVAYDNGNLTGNVALDYTNGNWQTGTLTGNITLQSVTNWPPTGQAGALTLILTQDGSGSRILTSTGWHATTNGTQPVLSTGAGDVDKLVLSSRDAGTTEYIDLVGADYVAIA